MRVVLAHTSQDSVRDIRQALHGAGVECAAEDCVGWDDLAMRLGQTQADLIVLHIQGGDELDWAKFNDAKMFTTAPVLAIGPNGDGDTEAAARQAGIAEYVQHHNLQLDLDSAIERLVGTGDVKPHRGHVVCVASPMPGQGSTIVSLGMAAHYARMQESSAACAELAAGYGKIAMLLDMDVEISLSEVCERLHRMDRPSMARSMMAHESGLNLLLKKRENTAHEVLDREAVRRICLLLRASMQHSVLSAGGLLEEPQLEAMRSSDRVVLVLRPDVPTLTRAIWTIDRAVDYGVPIDRMAVALNYWGERSLVPIKQVVQTLSVPDVFTVPYDPGHVNRAANEGALFQHRFPRSRVARAIAGIAQAMAPVSTQ